MSVNKNAYIINDGSIKAIENVKLDAGYISSSGNIMVGDIVNVGHYQDITSLVADKDGSIKVVNITDYNELQKDKPVNTILNPGSGTSGSAGSSGYNFGGSIASNGGASYLNGFVPGTSSYSGTGG